jgi:peptidoglycan-N-acetylglucosamine deacetylase
MDHSFNWPDQRQIAVSLTFDVDAEAGLLGAGEEYRKRLSALSEARFGIRRGLPRILALLERYGIQGTFFVPGWTAEQYPDSVREILSRGHEVGHHGFLHLRSHLISPESQREEIERGLDAFQAIGARRPVGHRSASWELTPETFELLIEHNFAYDSSCMGDDRPYLERWDGKTVVELPVHWSLDDWPHFGWSLDLLGNLSPADELYATWRAEYAAARAEGRSLVLTMHPEVIGRAYRLELLERLIDEMAQDGGTWFASLSDICDHVRPYLAETEGSASDAPSPAD